MANDFMKNCNKINLDGEIVGYTDTFPVLNKVEVKKAEVIEESFIENKSLNDDEIMQENKHKGKKKQNDTFDDTLENEELEENFMI